MIQKVGCSTYSRRHFRKEETSGTEKEKIHHKGQTKGTIIFFKEMTFCFYLSSSSAAMNVLMKGKTILWPTSCSPTIISNVFGEAYWINQASFSTRVLIACGDVPCILLLYQCFIVPKRAWCHYIDREEREDLIGQGGNTESGTWYRIHGQPLPHPTALPLAPETRERRDRIPVRVNANPFQLRFILGPQQALELQRRHQADWDRFVSESNG